jgi:hypothetical protein
MLVILEGNERTGKTTIAKALEAKGFKYVHFSSPHKKYFQQNYVGPTYLDDMVEFLVSTSGKDYVLDRSTYGELIYPKIFNRPALLSQEDIETLREIEDSLNVVRVLMVDENVNAHWKRCVENKEPINQIQFSQINSMFMHLHSDFGFTQASLGYLSADKIVEAILNAGNQGESLSGRELTSSNSKQQDIEVVEAKIEVMQPVKQQHISAEQKRLLEANAINDILSARVIKKKGDYFDVLEDKIRAFLNNEMAILLGTRKEQQHIKQNSLTDDEVEFLRILVKKAKETKR